LSKHMPTVAALCEPIIDGRRPLLQQNWSRQRDMFM
jgi:hypothetical protein